MHFLVVVGHVAVVLDLDVGQVVVEVLDVLIRLGRHLLAQFGHVIVADEIEPFVLLLQAGLLYYLKSIFLLVDYIMFFSILWIPKFYPVLRYFPEMCQ